MRKCKAITKKGKPCPIQVEEWRKADLCHVHDPDGNFKKGLRRKGKNPERVSLQKCQHTWYMREQGIVCTKCLIVWEKGMD
jgi:hypothetical protein